MKCGQVHLIPIIQCILRQLRSERSILWSHFIFSFVVFQGCKNASVATRESGSRRLHFHTEGEQSTAGQTSTADVHVFVKPGKNHQASILCLIDKTMPFTYFIIGITIIKKRQFKTIT